MLISIKQQGSSKAPSGCMTCQQTEILLQMTELSKQHIAS